MFEFDPESRRLECLRLAIQAGLGPAAVEYAEYFEAFLVGPGAAETVSAAREFAQKVSVAKG